MKKMKNCTQKTKLSICRKICRRQFLPRKEEKAFLHKAQKTQTIQEKKETRLHLKFTICMLSITFKVKRQATFREKIISHKRSSQKGST